MVVCTASTCHDRPIPSLCLAFAQVLVGGTLEPNKTDYLDYPTARAAGWPVASGIIEGTCRMLQDHLSLRATNEARLGAVVDSDGVAHGTVEAGHRRPLATIFGSGRPWT